MGWMPLPRSGWGSIDPPGSNILGLALSGLLDGTFAEEEILCVREGLAGQELTDSRFRNLRTRRGVAYRFALVELEVSTDWSVQRSMRSLPAMRDRASSSAIAPR